MVLVGRALIFVGLAAIVAGVGFFGYVLFVYPTSLADEPFRLVAGSEAASDAPSPTITVGHDGFCRVAVRFRPSSEYYRVISGDTHYLLRCTATVRDAAGRVVFEFDDDIHEKGPTVVHRSDRTDASQSPAAAAEPRPAQGTSSRSSAPEGAASEGATTDGAATESAAADSPLSESPDFRPRAVEHHLPAFPVRAGDRLAVVVAVVNRPPPADEPMAATNIGTVSDVEWRMLIGDYDPEARRNFRADGPTYGLQAAGAGLLLLVLGNVVGRRGRRRTAGSLPAAAR